MIGAGLGYLSDPATEQKIEDVAGHDVAKFVTDVSGFLIRVLNVPAEWLESGIGAAILASDDKKAVLDNIPLAMKAGKTTYESYAAQLPIQNIPAGLEWIWDMLVEGRSDVTFAKTGEMWHLPKQLPDGTFAMFPQPIAIDVYGKAALAEARNMLLKGADPNQVVGLYQQVYGFSGTFTDLIGQMSLDPLNVMPGIERIGIGTMARITGNVPLEIAARISKGDGWYGTLKTYGGLLRQGYGPAVSEMTPFQRTLAGVTKSGLISELRPGAPGASLQGIGQATSMNPQLWLKSLMELTPGSRAREMLGLAHENAGLLLNMAESNPDQMFELMRSWIELPPADAAEVAKMLGLPEAVTVRQALAGFSQPLNEWYARWTVGKERRAVLANISRAIGETQAKTLEMLRSSDAETVRRLLLDKSDPQRRAVLEADPNYSARALQEMAGFFKNNP